MSFSGAPNTANKKWVYIADPTAMLSNPVIAESALCYYYAQGYTGMFMYKLNNYTSGPSFGGNSALFVSFIQKCQAKGLVLVGVFGGDNTLDAINSFNASNPSTPFYGAISEIEWWNYSGNLPWVSQDSQGNHSFYDTVEMFQARKTSMLANGLKLMTYNGWTKGTGTVSPIYDSSTPLVNFDVDNNRFVVRGDYLALNGGTQFEKLNGTNGSGQNQVIKVSNFPKAGVTSYFDVINVLLALGNTELYVYPSLASVYKMTIASYSLTSNVATLNVTFPPNAAPYRLDVSDLITVAGLLAPFNGNFVITAVTGSSISYALVSGNVGLTTGGLGTVKLRFLADGNPGSPNYKLKYSYNIVSVSASPRQIEVRGDKRFRFSGTNRVTKINVTDTVSPILLTVAGAPTYSAITKLTTIPVVEDPTGIVASWSNTVTFRGFADMDVSGKSNTTYSALYGDASELEQLYEVVDEHWIHVYVGGVPSYAYAKTRCAQLGLGGANTGLTRDVGFIGSAEPGFSGPWFGGAGGPPKTVEQAYGSIVKNMSPLLPAQTGSPLYAQLETNANINAHLNIIGVAIFKDDLIRAINTANGPRVYVNAGANQSFVASSFPGTTPLTGYFCDDQFPGSGTYTYLWTIVSQPAGSSVATLTNATSINAILNYQRAGLYVLQLQVTDPAGATGAGTTEVLINVTPSLTVSIDVTNATCHATTDGTITVSVLGGTEPYDYTISDGVYTDSNTTGIFTGVPAGTYLCSVTDSLGATGSNTATVTTPPAIRIGLAIEQADCTLEPLVDLATGIVKDTDALVWTITDGGSMSGSPVYSNNPCSVQTTGVDGNIFYAMLQTNALVLPSDPYLGCEYLMTVNLATNEFDSLIDIVSDAGAASFLLPAGTLAFGYNLGVAPTYVQIQISVTESGNTPQNLVFDSYSITVHPSCSSRRYMGAASVSPTGGVAPYTVLWSTGETTTSIAAPTGNYQVWVTDSNRCEEGLSFQITKAPDIIITASVTDALCAGTPSGTIDVAVTGGIAPYTYAWVIGSFSTSPLITGLVAGDYTIEVTDSKGCTAQQTITIGEMSPTSIELNIKVDNCQGDPIGLTVQNPVGQAPYTYTWYLDGIQVGTGTNVTLPSKPPGIYVVGLIMVDANGCIASAYETITVYQNVLPVITITTTDPPMTSCTGSQVLLTANNQGSFTVEWYDSNGNFLASGPTYAVTNTYMIANSTPGNSLTFEARLTQISCISNAFYDVAYPTSTNITIIALVPNMCGVPGNNGYIDIGVSNGCAPYTYAWTGPGGYTATTEDITGLASGSYTVTVTDNDGNIATRTIIVPTSAPTIDGAVVVNNCGTNSTGSITPTVSGGTQPYAYTWSGPNGFTSSGPNISGLANGTYTLVITDNFGCTDEMDFDIILDPLYVSVLVIKASCDGLTMASAEAIVTGGDSNSYSYLWSTGETTSSISNLPDGQSYTLTVTCNNSCSASKAFFIPTRVPMTVTISGQNPSTRTSTDGLALVKVTGGSGIHLTIWNTGATTDLITGLGIGTYDVLVTDYNRCDVLKQIVLNAIDAPAPDPIDVAIKRYRCCVANLAYMAAVAHRTGSSKFSCLEFKSQVMSATFATYCEMLDANDICLTDAEKLKIVRLLDDVCNECKDCS